MQEAEQGNIMYEGDLSHSPCPFRASGTKATLWSAAGRDIYSVFTGHGLAATLMPHGSSWLL